MDAGLKRALELTGGPSGLSKLLENATPQAISQWDRVPPRRVPEVERVTGVPRHELRPDLWNAPAPSESQAAE